MSFDLGDADLDVVARGVRELNVPQAQPWGPSAYVNDIRGLQPLASGLIAMDIELQSGDTIRVVAESFEPPAESWPQVHDSSQLPLGPDT